jgi:hypothetical protein
MPKQKLFVHKNNFSSKTKVFGTFVFTDIVQSSILWKNYPKKMHHAIKEHEKITHKIIDDYNGMVVKTIGDSFMIFFKGKNGFKKAIDSSIDIQKSFVDKPIYLSRKKNDVIKIRLGMCTGEAFTHKVDVQGYKLRDFYGTVVNIASRMESKVSREYEIAMSFYKTKIPMDYLLDLAEYGKKNDEFEMVIRDYKKTCKAKSTVKKHSYKQNQKRSERLLSYACREEIELKGVPAIKTFVIKFIF